MAVNCGIVIVDCGHLAVLCHLSFLSCVLVGAGARVGGAFGSVSRMHSVCIQDSSCTNANII